ncbi:Uncharacterised protein [Actinomyces bovis]|uniref:WXG100 family type VII secretion target n=1 Tax=Actinomyces bovis TaxID=1658 RepID=A0ABY1VRE7_9ACTO|nr:Uncharacterised protein [Actinomyces bovis]VEG56309.1 Uncharacterised protein [Actinomyces israelii]
MSAWDINVESVASILSSEKTEAETTLSTAMEGVGTALQGLFSTTGGEGGTQLVAAAVSEWCTNHQNDFKSVGNTISNVLTNTKSAVDSYLAHDEAAALEFQRKAK